jgi:hypothetical protein
LLLSRAGYRVNDTTKIRINREPGKEKHQQGYEQERKARITDQ